jgi:hypothetical protein
MADILSTATAPAIVNPDTLIRGEERDFVMEFLAKSDALKSRYVHTWNEVLENYMVLPTGWHQSVVFGGGTLPNRMERNNRRSLTKNPETHQIVETLAAQGIALILPKRGSFIRAVPMGEDDPVKADQVSKIIMAVLRGEGVRRTIYQILKDSFIFGTSILELSWETRSRWEMVKQQVFSPEGELLGTRYVPEEVIYRDRPMFRAIDIYDFYPDPSGTRIQEDMFGVAKRFRSGRHQIESLAASGVYDYDATTRAISNVSVSANGTSGDLGESGNFQSRFRSESRTTASHYGVMRGFEYWGHYPGRVSGADPYRNRVITLLEGEVVRSRINPYKGGRIPFKEFTVNPVQGRFYGLGPAEVVRFQQDSLDSIDMTITDAVNLMTNPNLLVGIGFRGDVDELKYRQFNGVIECHDVKSVGLIPQDFGAIAVGQQEIARRTQMIRNASGATDTPQAIGSSTEKTATETSILTRFATQRINSVIELMESDDWPWVGHGIHDMLVQFGEGSDIVTKLHGEPLLIPFEDIDTDADIMFVGSQVAQSQFQALQGNSNALNILGTNPEAVEQYPDLVERILESLEIPDAKKQVARAIEVAQQRRALQVAMAQQAQEKFPAGQIGATQNNAITTGEADFGTEAGQTEKQGQAVA